VPTSTSHDVDALRAKLRELGYLDAGVGRFVLGAARAGRSPWSVAWRAGGRIGLLAGLLLAVSAPLALAARLPGLLAGPRDALLVAAYLGAAFGLAVWLAAALVTFVASRLVRLGPGLARRARALSAGTGILVGAACLAYLTLWWNAAGSALPSPLWTAVALGAAVVMSLLLGQATSAAAAAVVALTAPEPAAPAARRSRAQRAALALTAFAGAAALLSLTARPARPLDPSPLVVVPTGLRLLVVGVDGLDPVFASAVAAGSPMPALTHLLAAPHAPLARAGDPDPVRVWVTMATGQPASRHGVTGIETRQVAGLEGRLPSATSRLAAALSAASDLVRLTRPAVVTSRERRERTFWEVAALAGLRVAVVNWWTTWPADPAEGTILSDRAVLRLERGGPLAGEIAPAALYPELQAAWPDIDRLAVGAAAAAFPTPRSPLEEAAARAVRLDAQHVELARRVGAETDLLAVYLPGLDIAQVALFGEPAALAPSDLEARRTVLARTYTALDRLLARLMELPDRSVVLVAWPGRIGGASPGRLAVSGPGAAEAPADPAPARLEDVAPTILFGLGAPVSGELAGRARTDLFSAAINARSPLRMVETWGRRGAPPRPVEAGRALDEEMRERLRSLGYVR
jgi:phosphatidylserine decarboxylase